MALPPNGTMHSAARCTFQGKHAVQHDLTGMMAGSERHPSTDLKHLLELLCIHLLAQDAQALLMDLALCLLLLQ